MLEPWMIEELKKRREREIMEDRRLPLYVPLPLPLPPPRPPAEAPDTEVDFEIRF